MSFFTIIFPLDSGRPLENETSHFFPAYRHCDELLNSMLLVLAMEAVYARANDDTNTACRFSSTTFYSEHLIQMIPPDPPPFRLLSSTAIMVMLSCSIFVS